MNLYTKCQWGTNLRKYMLDKSRDYLSPPHPPLGKMCDPSFELEFGLEVLEMQSMY